MDYAQLVIISILVEAIWENLKFIRKDKQINVNMIGSLIISIVICVLARVDIFAVIGIDLSVKVIGSILTGIIVSRGANFVNDLFTRLKGE